MLPKINPTQTSAWKALAAHFEVLKNSSIKSQFENNQNRFEEFSITQGDILFDYSKNNINNTTIDHLIQLANECELPAAIAAMFDGEKINETENRAVLHTALRNFSSNPVVTDGKNVMPDIRKVLDQMNECCNNIHEGFWKGYTGKNIKYIVIVVVYICVR